MPRDEVTGRHPSNFSEWHRRKLPDRCALADDDWCEIREGSVVAILEAIQVKPEHIEKAGDWILTDPWLKSWYPKYDERQPEKCHPFNKYIHGCFVAFPRDNSCILS